MRKLREERGLRRSRKEVGTGSLEAVYLVLYRREPGNGGCQQRRHVPNIDHVRGVWGGPTGMPKSWRSKFPIVEIEFERKIKA